jgi:hypothetical protein
MRTDETPTTLKARGLALWVLVCGGLAYGVINTAIKVTDLFGG